MDIQTAKGIERFFELRKKEVANIFVEEGRLLYPLTWMLITKHPTLKISKPEFIDIHYPRSILGPFNQHTKELYQDLLHSAQAEGGALGFITFREAWFVKRPVENMNINDINKSLLEKLPLPSEQPDKMELIECVAAHTRFGNKQWHAIITRDQDYNPILGEWTLMKFEKSIGPMADLVEQTRSN